MATIRDVSKLAGVSVSTVSRVINKTGYVNKATEQIVMDAMEKLQYKPNPIARSLAGKQTYTIALMVPDILNPFFPELAKAVEQSAKQFGYSVILCNTDNDPATEREYFDVLTSKQIDGLIIASYTVTAGQLMELKQKGISLVVIDNDFADYPLISLVADNRNGAKRAVEHLISGGCQKIGHISGPMHIAAAYERCVGYEEASREKPWYSPSLLERGDFHLEGGYQAMERLLARHPDLDGIFVGNDLMAVGALRFLLQRNINIPQHIKIIAFDGISLNMSMPELTTMAQPITEMGALAMQYLYQQMKGETVTYQTHMLDVTLEQKETT